MLNKSLEVQPGLNNMLIPFIIVSIEHFLVFLCTLITGAFSERLYYICATIYILHWPITLVVQGLLLFIFGSWCRTSLSQSLAH